MTFLIPFAILEGCGGMAELADALDLKSKAYLICFLEYLSSCNILIQQGLLIFKKISKSSLMRIFIYKSYVFIFVKFLEVFGARMG